jgi:hypothetical protein
MPETWIEQATAAFGEPSVAIAEPVIRPGLHRRCWAWNVNGHNFYITIDKDGDWCRTSAGAPYRQGSFSTEATEPTDAQVRSLLTFCWPGFAEASDA